VTSRLFVRLSVRSHNSKTTWPTSPIFGLWPWLGPLLTALRYVMYFRFLDDLMFAENGSIGDAKRINV